ncbi:MAG TPA: spermidine/putrescine ABC transporter substrate-binding protein [Nitriliruptorales bacterium]
MTVPETDPPPLPGMSRRVFVGASAGAVGAAAVALLASRAGSSGSRGPDIVRAGSDDQLRLWNWELYIDEDEPGAPGTITRFQQRTGIAVSYDDSYPGNVEALTGTFAQLADGPLPYDVTVPTYWVAERLHRNGWLEPIPLELVPNHVNVDPTYLGMPWDRGGRYHMPWQVGMTGIAYDPSLTGFDLNRIEDLFDRRLAGRVAFVGEMREAVGLTMMAGGADPSRATLPAAQAALDRIADAAASGHVSHFGFFELRDLLESGEVAATMMWSGDAYQLIQTRPDIAFVVPDEGAIRWFDTMVIPRGAANRAAAAEWMNFVYDPANAAAISAYVQYISPVTGVREELLSQGLTDLASSPILFPPDDVQRRLYVFGGLEPDDADELDEAFAVVGGLV